MSKAKAKKKHHQLAFPGVLAMGRAAQTPGSENDPDRDGDAMGDIDHDGDGPAPAAAPAAGGAMGKSEEHPGFDAVAHKIAAKEGLSEESGRKIAAAAARNASAAAKRANPHLNRVAKSMAEALIEPDDKRGSWERITRHHDMAAAHKHAQKLANTTGEPHAAFNHYHREAADGRYHAYSGHGELVNDLRKHMMEAGGGLGHIEVHGIHHPGDDHPIEHAMKHGHLSIHKSLGEAKKAAKAMANEHGEPAYVKTRHEGHHVAFTDTARESMERHKAGRGGWGDQSQGYHLDDWHSVHHPDVLSKGLEVEEPSALELLKGVQNVKQHMSRSKSGKAEVVSAHQRVVDTKALISAMAEQKKARTFGSKEKAIAHRNKSSAHQLHYDHVGQRYVVAHDKKTSDALADAGLERMKGARKAAAVAEKPSKPAKPAAKPKAAPPAAKAEKKPAQGGGLAAKLSAKMGAHAPGDLKVKEGAGSPYASSAKLGYGQHLGGTSSKHLQDAADTFTTVAHERAGHLSSPMPRKKAEAEAAKKAGSTLHEMGGGGGFRVASHPDATKHMEKLGSPAIAAAKPAGDDKAAMKAAIDEHHAAHKENFESPNLNTGRIDAASKKLREMGVSGSTHALGHGRGFEITYNKDGKRVDTRKVEKAKTPAQARREKVAADAAAKPNPLKGNAAPKEAPKPKQPHEMTYDEYRNSYHSDVYGSTRHAHQSLISDAIKHGKDVPENVMAEHGGHGHNVKAAMEHEKEWRAKHGEPGPVDHEADYGGRRLQTGMAKQEAQDRKEAAAKKPEVKSKPLDQRTRETAESGHQKSGEGMSKIKVPMHANKAPVEIDAHVKNGLAVHPMVGVNGKPTGHHTVTHVASGLAFGHSDSKEGAEALRDKLHKTKVNFDKPATAFTPEEKQKLGKVVTKHKDDEKKAWEKDYDAKAKERRAKEATEREQRQATHEARAKALGVKGHELAAAESRIAYHKGDHAAAAAYKRQEAKSYARSGMHNEAMASERQASLIDKIKAHDNSKQAADAGKAPAAPAGVKAGMPKTASSKPIQEGKGKMKKGMDDIVNTATTGSVDEAIKRYNEALNQAREGLGIVEELRRAQLGLKDEGVHVEVTGNHAIYYKDNKQVCIKPLGAVMMGKSMTRRAFTNGAVSAAGGPSDEGTIPSKKAAVTSDGSEVGNAIAAYHEQLGRLRAGMGDVAGMDRATKRIKELGVTVSTEGDHAIYMKGDGSLIGRHKLAETAREMKRRTAREQMEFNGGKPGQLVRR